MKSTLLTSVSLAALVAFSGQALSADVFGGSSKDSPAQYVPDSRVSTHSGFYITGTLGFAQGDRTVSGEVTGEKIPLGELNDEGDFVQLDNEDALTGLVEGPLDTLHVLNFGEDRDFDARVFGGEVSYLIQMPDRRFGVEIGLGANGYDGGDSTVNFAGIPTDFKNVLKDGVLVEEGPSNTEVEGVAKFNRDFDIDLVAKAHYFVDPRFSIYAGGGVSWASASLKGGHDNNNLPEGTYDNSYNQGDTAIGYVIVAGAQYWVTDRVVVGLGYSYKAHEFDFSSGASTDSFDLEGDVSGAAWRRNTTDDVKVEDDVHTIMGRIGIKLN